MRLLLDTHILLWWQDDGPRLSDQARTLIRNADQVFVSVVSAWEIAIKIAVNKLSIPEPVEAVIDANGFLKLGVSFSHAERVARLPLLHADPFDRMLVVQAQAEDLSLLTADQRLAAYDAKVIHV